MSAYHSHSAVDVGNVPLCKWSYLRACVACVLACLCVCMLLVSCVWHESCKSYKLVHSIVQLALYVKLRV